MTQQNRNRAIREAKKRGTQQRGSAADEARETIANSGSSVGESLGEHVAPPEPPPPGEVPGGNNDRQAHINQVPTEEAYVGGKGPLPDDYDQVMADNGMAHEANQNKHGGDNGGMPPVQNQNPGKGERVKEEHPVLGSLRRDFGLDSIGTEDVKIDGHIWTLGPLDVREMGLITRLADEFGTSPGEREMTANCAISAVATRAIDGVPVYKVFGVEAPPGAHIENPMLPPRPTRTKGAFSLFEFLTEESKNKLTHTLFEAYADKLDDKDQVNSYLNDPENPRYRYRNHKSGYEFIDFPNYDRHGEEQPYYCKYTGEKMKKIAQVVGGDESPL